MSRRNLTDDGTYKYTYDPWNRLVKVTAQDTDVTIQTAEYDGLGRRIKKVVSNSGDLDGTTVYYYNGHQIIETRDGSGNMVSQVYHGTRYIDEVAGLRLQDGRAYVYQDANYNVIGLTDLTGRVLERYSYSPYGELEVAFDVHFFDWNDDGDVDATDLAAATSGGDCWGDYSGDCRRLDADADRNIDADDYAAISAFIDELSGDQEIQRTPAPTRSQLGNVFAHQGLVLDAEIGSYQNRARQYNPRLKRFMQRDPLTASRCTGGRCAGRGYQDGLNLYECASSRPVSYLDPHGLDTFPPLEPIRPGRIPPIDIMPQASRCSSVACELEGDPAGAYCIPSPVCGGKLPGTYCSARPDGTGKKCEAIGKCVGTPYPHRVCCWCR